MAQTRSPAHAAYGQAFRQLRGQRGISQERLAQLAGLDRTYVSGIERGERNPSLTNLLKLAETLNVRLLDIAARADTIAATTGRRGQRHPISYALEQAALTLKDAHLLEAQPLTRADSRDVLQDASRVLAELIETLARLEHETGQRIGVFRQLEAGLHDLERAFSSR